MFTEQDNQEDGREDEEGTAGDSFSRHWGWWGTLYTLSKSNRLAITGDKAIVDVNFLTAINYLEIDKDFNEEVRKIEKREIQLNRNRR